MFKPEFHVPYDFPQTKIGGSLKKDLMMEIFDTACDRRGSQGELTRYLAEASSKYGAKKKIWQADICNYREGRCAIPFWILNELRGITSISYEEIQNGIEWYRGPGPGQKIYPEVDGQRKLPILHTPYLDYLCGIINSSYSKTALKIKESSGKSAYETAVKVFGRFSYSEAHTGPFKRQTQVCLPKIIKDVLDFCHPFTSPDEPDQNIVAYITGVIVNRGGVPSGITILKNNRKFLERINVLLQSLGCETKISQKETYCELKIYKQSSKRLVELVENLLPNDLRFLPKQQMLIEQRIKRERAGRLNSETRKREIIKSLRKKPKTISELSIEIGLASSTLYNHYIPPLKKSGVIKVVEERKISKKYANVWGC